MWLVYGKELIEQSKVNKDFTFLKDLLRLWQIVALLSSSSQIGIHCLNYIECQLWDLLDLVQNLILSFLLIKFQIFLELSIVDKVLYIDRIHSIGGLLLLDMVDFNLSDLLLKLLFLFLVQLQHLLHIFFLRDNLLLQDHIQRHLVYHFLFPISISDPAHWREHIIELFDVFELFVMAFDDKFTDEK